MFPSPYRGGPAGAWARPAPAPHQGSRRTAARDTATAARDTAAGAPSQQQPRGEGMGSQGVPDYGNLNYQREAL